MNEPTPLRTDDQPLLVIAGIPMWQNEYITAQKDVRRVSRLIRIAWPITAIGLAIVTLGLAAEVSTEARVVSTLGWLLVGMVLTVVNTLLQRRREREAVANMYGLYLKMRGEQPDQVRFYRDHIECVSSHRRLAVPYTEIVEFSETPQQFTLYAEGVMIVLPARALTAEQAQEIYNILAVGLPDGRITYRGRLRPLLVEPLPVPAYPDRPVTPPLAKHEPLLRMEEQRQQLTISHLVNTFRAPMAVIAGLLTALLIDPAGVYYAADGLCVLVWILLSQLVVLLFARTTAKHTRPFALGLSPSQEGITVYIRYGEMFVPRELISVRDMRDGLLVQTPVESLYLRYASLPDPAAVKRYFGL